MNSKPVLVIGNKNYSSWSLRAWLLLKHLNIDFEEIRVPLYSGNFKETLYRYSSSGKVPVYIDEGVTTWDSLAICEYMAERHPDLWPTDQIARATARSISAEMHSGFVDLRNEMPMNCRATGRRVDLTPGARDDISRIDDIWTSCRTLHGENGPWLFGSFGIADVMYAPVASRFQTYGTEIGDVAGAYRDTMLSMPLLRQWYRESEQEPEVLDRAEAGV